MKRHRVTITTMPVIPITSLDDPLVLPYSQIKGHDPKRLGVFIVESEMLVRRAIESGFEVVSLLCSDRVVERLAQEFGDRLTLLSGPEAQINAILGFNFHRGVMACVKRPTAAQLSLDRLLPATTLVVCPFITQNENLGLILRAAAGLGADGLLIGDRGADPFSRQAVRVSTGASFQFPIAISADVHADLARLRSEHGMQLVGTVLAPDAIPLHQFKRSGRIALLIGSEFDGLDERSMALCDAKVTIAMHHGIDSLNVAMATGIFLHHLQSPR